MQTPIFLILFLAPVYVPLDLLTGWVHAVADVNPVTAMVEAGRDLISGRGPVLVASGSPAAWSRSSPCGPCRAAQRRGAG